MADEIRTSVSTLVHGHEAFPESGLDSLIAAAAGDDPDVILMRDDHGASTAGQLARRVGRLAALFRHAGFASGERVLIVADATTAAVVALAASLRAGLEPALVPPGLGAAEIAVHAQTAKAAALLGPSRSGGLDLGDTYLAAAALAEPIRMIATQGPDPVDGAVDVSFDRLDAMVDIIDPGVVPGHGDPPVIVTFQGASDAPMLVAHRQAALFADALALVEQARIHPSAPIVSTLPPSTLAGLVAGPFAALIGAAELVLHGPFDAVRFLAACDREPGYHLVAPAPLGGLFEDGALTVDMVSLVLVSRFVRAEAFAIPGALACDRPVIDIYAFGEETMLARRRRDGRAQPPSRVADRSRDDAGLGTHVEEASAAPRRHRTEGG